MPLNTARVQAKWDAEGKRYLLHGGWVDGTLQAVNAVPVLVGGSQRFVMQQALSVIPFETWARMPARDIDLIVVQE